VRAVEVVHRSFEAEREHIDALGDAVVDLAQQAAALLVGGAFEVEGALLEGADLALAFGLGFDGAHAALAFDTDEEVGEQGRRSHRCGAHSQFTPIRPG
jgi:hypothetical protein